MKTAFRKERRLTGLDPETGRPKFVANPYDVILKRQRSITSSPFFRIHTLLNEMQRAIWQERLTDQSEALQRERVKLNEMIERISEVSETELQAKLNDAEPLTRWLAIQVINRKRLPWDCQLVERLDDADAAVQQAARKALVRLSRGNDFGPAPNATPEQCATARRRWQTWLSLQNLSSEEPLPALAVRPLAP